MSAILAHKEPPSPAPRKGDEIRAHIEANRLKRLAIAEAMKQEADVTGHEINTENFGGLAYIGTGKILSPEGQNMRQLYTVAHECGHIFLHNAPPGITLPSHVMELEAESYAHQAFREHGMELPRFLSQWGRSYVGSWVEKDRAAGIAIDPRAEAYANGTRSPFEPLRMVPPSWVLHKADPNAPRIAMPRPEQGVKRTLLGEAMDILRSMASSLFYGSAAAYIGLKILNIWIPMPDLFEGKMAEPRWALLPIVLTAGLLWANLVMLWRTIRR
jgi:hypothetical protein